MEIPFPHDTHPPKPGSFFPRIPCGLPHPPPFSRTHTAFFKSPKTVSLPSEATLPNSQGRVFLKALRARPPHSQEFRGQGTLTLAPLITHGLQFFPSPKVRSFLGPEVFWKSSSPWDRRSSSERQEKLVP